MYIDKWCSIWDIFDFWKSISVQMIFLFVHRLATRGGGGGLSCPSSKIEKIALILEKRPWLCPSLGYAHLWKKLRIFSLRGLFFLCFWWNVYRSALVTRKLPCPEKFVVARLVHLVFVVESSMVIFCKMIHNILWAYFKWTRF